MKTAIDECYILIIPPIILYNKPIHTNTIAFILKLIFYKKKIKF